jgi:hypothetical protein
MLPSSIEMSVKQITITQPNTNLICDKTINVLDTLYGLSSAD